MKPFIVIFVLLASLSAVGTPVYPQIPPGAKKQEQRLKLEMLGDYYRKWLDTDVAYIALPEERDVFLNLTTDAERDQFIQQFWLRRDPDPGTSNNEYKEEHYRRIQYANDRFHAGIPGWKTDRGRVYIMFGAPDRTESSPAGGPYTRRPNEGGGQTSVFPFERWTYRHIEGVGSDIELEFVNDAGGNLYRLTMDPQDKDEFLRVPGMGLTYAEMMHPDFAGEKSFDRVNRIRRQGSAENQGIFVESSKDDPFQKAELLMRISKPPVIRYKDLQEVVTAKVRYNQLVFQAVTHSLRVDTHSLLVPLTVTFSGKDLSFRKDDDRYTSDLKIYGLVSTMIKRAVYEFDDDISADYSAAQMELARNQPGMYQRKMILPPGSYKLDLVLKDNISGKTGTLAVSLQLPAPQEDRLGVSSIMLTEAIEPADGDITQPYVVGPYRLKPQADSVFIAGDQLGFYLEAYDYLLDQTTQLPVLQIQYAIVPRGKLPAAYRPLTQGVTLAGKRVIISRMIQLTGREKGFYDLVCSITDRLSNQSVSTRAPFEIR